MDRFSQDFYGRDSFDDIAEGQQPYANFKTVYFVIYLSSFMTDFHETSLTWILLMRQSKWGATTLISWLILMDFYKPSLTGIPLIRQHNERQQPYANFKTAHVVKYIGSFLMDFHKTSITGILLMRWLKWGATTLNWKLILIYFYKPSLEGIPLIRQLIMRGNNPMLTSKLHVLLNISASCWFYIL